MSVRLLCALAFTGGALFADLSGAGNAPAYSAASVVNAASQIGDAFSPNSIATVYGTNLSWDEYAIAPADVANGSLPQTLRGVTVFVGGLQANLFYVSPKQINFLIPYEFTSGQVNLYVARNGVRGPDVTIQLRDSSPGFFEWNGNLAVAQHANGDVISPDSPAHAGETIVLYATGLGHTSPSTQSGRLALNAAQITRLPNLQVLLNGAPSPARDIFYAGLTPGFAGLYQINVRLPDSLPSNPVIQVAIGSDVSPAGVQLMTQ